MSQSLAFDSVTSIQSFSPITPVRCVSSTAISLTAFAGIERAVAQEIECRAMFYTASSTVRQSWRLVPEKILAVTRSALTVTTA